MIRKMIVSLLLVSSICNAASVDIPTHQRATPAVLSVMKELPSHIIECARDLRKVTLLHTEGCFLIKEGDVITKIADYNIDSRLQNLSSEELSRLLKHHKLKLSQNSNEDYHLELRPILPMPLDFCRSFLISRGL